jgi:uncharacterized protein (DUF433 family)
MGESMSELLARITVDPNRMHGRPCIRDLGLTVADILGLLAAGQSRETILGDYPALESADIDAALTFAAHQIEAAGNLLSLSQDLTDQHAMVTQRAKR